MYAVFTEVDAEDSHKEAGREMLNRLAVPGSRAAGAKGGYWLEPQNGRGVSIVVFETEAEARALADRFEVGKPPDPSAPEGVVFRTVEVREVIAAV
jgi:hypothetical protein